MIKDFAVGAPYEANGASKGALYIFRGNKNPMAIRLSQILYASQFEHIGGEIQGFSSSISGGADLDGNGYPDIVVGSYLNESIHILRTYPVVKINSNLNNSDSLQSIDYLQCKSYANQTCFQLNMCFSLVKTKALNMTYRLSLTNDNETRVYFKPNRTYHEHHIEFTSQQADNCELIDVYLNNQDDYDNINLISFNLTFANERPTNRNKRFNLSDIDSYPMVHEDNNYKIFEVSNYSLFLNPSVLYKILLVDLLGKLNLSFFCKACRNHK